MKLTCSSCQSPIQLDDAKVPSGLFKIKCPKCGKVITAQKDAPASSTNSAAAASSSETAALDPPENTEDEISPAVRQFIKSEVSAMKKEILGALTGLLGGENKWQGESGEESDDMYTGKRALICEDDQSYVDTISTVMRRLGFGVDVAKSCVDALKKLDNGFYQMVTIENTFPDDPEGGAKILGKLNGQKPAQRRQMFIVLIAANIKSADANAAFFHGANITIHKAEIKNLEPIIREGQRHFKEMYSVFDRVMAEKDQHV